MCFSHNVIEQQSFKICDEIREHSIYKLVSIATTGGESIKINENTSLESNIKLLSGETIPLVTKVILEDASGRHYSVSPDEAGLQFAKGEVTYKEYLRLQAKEKRQLTTVLITSVGTLILISWSVLQFLI